METDNKRWEKIYENVVSEGTKIKKRRTVIKISAVTLFSAIFFSLFFFNLPDMEKETGLPDGYAYTEDNIEIALIAQGVFFDEEFGLLME